MDKKAARRIFVVDDEPVIASTLALILERDGFSVVSFTDPQEALKSFRQECPDLLLTDVAMPELSGIDLAISARRLCASCRILLFSGHADTASLLYDRRNQGYEFECLSKPVHPSSLLRDIKRLVG